eukprot:GAHX01002450.1.p1 GENE.GAHX01002450.1~~GAHX01002450.1.p1  ORF type:complete len:171 (-),score=30.38 GAHX01002450.1:325-837(-)
MAHIYSKTHLFNQKWDLVTYCHFRKYPSKLASHIKDVKCLNQTKDGTKEITDRVLTCEFNYPFLSHFLRNKTFDIKETTIVDPVRRITTLHTEHSLFGFFNFEEICQYSEDLEDKNKTRFCVESKLSLNKHIPFMSHIEEKISYMGLKQSRAGIRIMDQLCRKFKHLFKK